VETKKGEWEEKKGQFLCRLLEQMAWAYARDADDGTVVISDETPRWREVRASSKERNALIAALAIDPDDENSIRKLTDESARISREVEARWPPQAYFVSLSDDPHRAAEEIGFCLGDRPHLEALNPPPRHKLKIVCEAIWGKEWITPLARELDMSVRTAHRYAAGDTPVPDDIFVRLAPRVAKARQDLAARIDALSRV